MLGRGLVWCGVVWRGVACCGVACCGVACCGVIWCGVALYGLIQPSMLSFSSLPSSQRYQESLDGGEAQEGARRVGSGGGKSGVAVERV